MTSKGYINYIRVAMSGCFVKFRHFLTSGVRYQTVMWSLRRGTDQVTLQNRPNNTKELMYSVANGMEWQKAQSYGGGEDCLVFCLERTITLLKKGWPQPCTLSSTMCLRFWTAKWSLFHEKTALFLLTQNVNLIIINNRKNTLTH